ncbi:MAG TPA: TRAP transporter small permease [Desulfomonilaceae bacterium]|nr:TRAP transporter small permease [Desulfomonilaceae bacterium]
MKRFVRILNEIEEWTLVMVLLGLGFLCSVQVFCRYALHFSFVWSEEVNRYLGVFLAFLGAAVGVKYGSHFAMDLIYERVSSDRFRHCLKVVVYLLSCIMCFVVAWFGWAQAMKLRQFGVLTSALALPKYWAYLPIPFFSVVMGVRFFSGAAKHLRSMINGIPFHTNALSKE